MSMEVKDGLELHLVLEIDGELHDCCPIYVEAHYEIDGEDAPATWGYYGGSPAESISWTLDKLLFEDEDGDYAQAYLEETGEPLPFKHGEDILRHLSPAQVREVEEILEQDDRQEWEYRKAGV